MSNRPGGTAALPAEFAGQAGHVGAGRVAGDAAARYLVAGVPDELVVEDARARPARRVRSEHCDHRADPAVVGRLPQVLERFGGDVRGRADFAAVAHAQAVPVEPADAARAVPPGNAGAELQLGAGVPVGACGLDVEPHFGEPRIRRASGVLGVEQPDEALGAGQQLVERSEGGLVLARPWQGLATQVRRAGHDGTGLHRREQLGHRSRRRCGLLAPRPAARGRSWPPASRQAPAGIGDQSALVQAHGVLPGSPGP